MTLKTRGGRDGALSMGCTERERVSLKRRRAGGGMEPGGVVRRGGGWCSSSSSLAVTQH